MWDGKMLSALVICLFQMKTQTKKEKKKTTKLTKTIDI